jgi:hypothetical protein
VCTLILDDAAKVEGLLPGGLGAHHGGNALGLAQMELQHVLGFTRKLKTFKNSLP